MNNQPVADSWHLCPGASQDTVETRLWNDAFESLIAHRKQKATLEDNVAFLFNILHKLLGLISTSSKNKFQLTKKANHIDFLCVICSFK